MSEQIRRIFVEKKKEFNKFIITIRLVGKAIIMMGKQIKNKFRVKLVGWIIIL